MSTRKKKQGNANKNKTKTKARRNVGQTPTNENLFRNMLSQYYADGRKDVKEKLEKAELERAQLKEIATNTNEVATDNQVVLGQQTEMLSKHTEILKIIATPKQEFVKTIEKQRRELEAKARERARLEQNLLSTKRELDFHKSKTERHTKIVQFSRKARGKAANPAFGGRGSKARNRHPNIHGQKARQTRSKKDTKSKKNKAAKNSPKMSPK